MLTFKQYTTESFGGVLRTAMGGVMSPYGPNHNSNKNENEPKNKPTTVSLSPEAQALMKAKSGPSGPENSMAGQIGGTKIKRFGKRK